MERIADFMIEACFLKQIPRSGYAFLGAGRESVAEHVYCTMIIAFVISRMEPGVDAGRLINMCLVHDLPETRTGDLNYVQKKYVRADEDKALDDCLERLPFGPAVRDLIEEYKAARTLEARLAHDADQLSLIVDLNGLSDVGHQCAQTWLPQVRQRLKTSTGRKLADALAQRKRDQWWLKLFY